MANIIRQPCDEGVIRSKCRDAHPCSKDARPWVLAVAILGSSMAMIDGTVVNVALPVLQSRLNATTSDVQWIVESYALFLAALILVGGSLGDRFGRRRIFAWGVVLFMVASLGCGFAVNVNQLIVARAIQGVGGALLVPSSLAIISASFSEVQRGQAIGTWSGFTAITSAIGPVLGGWLVENVSWRWIFFINLPLGLIVLGILWWQVPESRDEQAKQLDWWGALLVIVGLGSTVYGLIEASHLGLLHPVVLGSVSMGVIVLFDFLVMESRHSNPLMPLELFRSKTFSGANLLTLLIYSAMGGVLYFVPFNLIQVQGYSVTATGAAFLPLILLMFLLSRWSGRLVDRYGAKRPLVFGSLVAAVGFALFTIPGVNASSYWTSFFPAIVVLGFGMAVSVAPLTTTVMGAVKVQQVGIASGINNAVARIAGLFAIAVANLVVLVTFRDQFNQRLIALRLPPEIQRALISQQDKLAGAEVPSGIDNRLRMALEIAIDQSFIHGFRLVMIIAVILALTSALIAVVWIQPNQQIATS